MTDHSDAAHIEQDIRRTRAELDDTIDALRDKLSPGEIIDELMPHVREGAVNMGRNFARHVKDNPAPFALMATGLAWLMMGRDDRRDGEPHGSAVAAYELDDDEYETLARHDHVHNALSAVEQTAGETLEAFNDRLYQAKAAALDLKQDVAEELGSFRRRIDQAFVELSGRAAAARRKLMRQGARIKSGAKKLAHRVEAQGEHAIESGRRYYEEHPLVVGALGIAAGAIIGSLLPSTQVEDRHLGTAGRRLRHRTSAAAHAASDAVRDAARHVAQTAKDAAAREGLTPDDARAAADDVVERAARVGEEVVESGRNELRERTPTR